MRQTQKYAGASEVLPAGLVEERCLYEKFWEFRLLYISLKQLEIEWRLNVILSKGGNTTHKIKHFYWYKQKKLPLEIACEKLLLQKAWKYKLNLPKINFYLQQWSQ